GWGYEYTPDNLLFQNGAKDDWTAILLRAGTFWFMMVDDAGQQQKITITASGGSENKQMQYALKGAITNMIGNAVSQIGFQESVYMGKRSHNTTGGNRSQGRRQCSSQPQTAAKAATAPGNKSANAAEAKAKSAPANATPAKPQTKPSREKAKAKSTAQAKPEAAPADETPYLVPKGAGIAVKHQGKTLAEMSDAALQFYAAGKFNPADEAGTILRQKCLEEVKARSNAS
ncbi:MAG: hypothetical protein K8R77_06130, partial [Anaerolineaceae bacterium]|nr:hypothetical protein [Anaerolineaceae bacterium]